MIVPNHQYRMTLGLLWKRDPFALLPKDLLSCIARFLDHYLCKRCGPMVPEPIPLYSIATIKICVYCLHKDFNAKNEHRVLATAERSNHFRLIALRCTSIQNEFSFKVDVHLNEQRILTCPKRLNESWFSGMTVYQKPHNRCQAGRDLVLRISTKNDTGLHLPRLRVFVMMLEMIYY